MTQEETQFINKLFDELYPLIKDMMIKDLVPFIQSDVNRALNEEFDRPLSIKEIAKIMGEKPETLYKRLERNGTIFPKSKPYAISRRQMNLQLDGKIDAEMLNLLENKPSKAESGESTGEAISEQ